MKQKEKLKCPVCNTKFIPRTFYPEEAIFSTSEGKKLSGFNGYISSRGVKPAEVILSSWITYCPNCNYVLKFVKEIVKKEKIQAQRPDIKEITEKYNSYYFGFPFEDYSQYLAMAVENVKKEIELCLKDLNLTVFENIYEIKDAFKLLVRFYANLENYCNSQFSSEIDSDLTHKIKALKLSVEMEEILLELNEIREKAIHSNYELSEDDKHKVNKAIVGFFLNLAEKHIKPLISNAELKTKYNYLDMQDLNTELKMYLNGYFKKIIKNGSYSETQIRTYLDQLLIN